MLMAVKGLPNIGLSCYINSVLQAFFHIKEFKEYITATDFMEKESFVYYFRCVFENLDKDIANQSEKIENDEKENLLIIFSVFKSFCEKFQESRQDDANHFLTFLLNKLDVEIISNFKKINQSSESNQFNMNIISELFRGEQEDRIICEKCKKTEDRKTKQNFFTLPLVIDKGSSLEQLLMSFFGDSYINGFECTDCAGGKLYKHTIITKWPKYLIINICRAQVNHSGKMVKIDTKISVDNHKLVVQDLSNFYSKDNGDSRSIEYKLEAVINHYGDTYSGHYTCIANTEFSWILFNDMEVKSVNEDSIISKANNLLFFKLSN